VAGNITALSPTTNYGLVTFATTAVTLQTLNTLSNLNTKLNTAYTGGYTNTQQAIVKCQAVLQGSTRRKVLILITDGNPTAYDDPATLNYAPSGGTTATARALTAFQNANSTGIQIIPVGVGADFNVNNPANIQRFSSTGQYLIASNFDTLPEKVDELVGTITCGG